MEEKRILTFSNYESNLLLNALTEYRNTLIKSDKSIKIINDLILRVNKAPIRKKSFFKKDNSYER